MLLVSCSMRMSRVYATAAITVISARMTAKLTTIRRRIVRFFIVSITLEPVTARRRKRRNARAAWKTRAADRRSSDLTVRGSAKERVYWIAQTGACAQLNSALGLDTPEL